MKVVSEPDALVLQKNLQDAAMGDPQARYELGVAYSCGLLGLGIDLIEAHKWFNLAAQVGSEAGQAARSEIAEEMTAREIVEAQRSARAWLRTVGALPTSNRLALAA
jgi:hypothetical protein